MSFAASFSEFVVDPRYRQCSGKNCKNIIRPQSKISSGYGVKKKKKEKGKRREREREREESGGRRRAELSDFIAY